MQWVDDCPYMQAAKRYYNDAVDTVWAHPYYTSAAVFVALTGTRVAVRRHRNRLPKQTMLELDLDRVQFMETRKDAVFRSFYKKKECFTAVLNVVEAAEKDERIKGLMVRVGTNKLQGAGRAAELRAALQRYHATTKHPVVCYADTFGEAGQGVFDYWVASSCTHVVMPSCGNINVTSMQSSGLFFKSVLERIGVSPSLTTRRMYKTAVNSLTQDGFSDEHREQNTTILRTLLGEIQTDLKQRSALQNPDTVLEDGPFTAAQAKERGLVDHLMYYDDFVDDVLPGLTKTKKDELAFRSLAAYAPHAKPLYAKRKRPWDKKKKKVAQIICEGRIHQGKSKKPIGYNGASIGSDTVVAQLKEVLKAVQKKKVDAVLLRIDSGGGSGLASMLIHHQLQKIAKEGVPIMVSCSNVAGSGGYLIALPASRIFVNPTSIAGSIGVINGKFAFKGVVDNLGINLDEVKTSENATYFSPLHPFEGVNRARLEAQTDALYEDFKGLVADSRGKTMDEVEDLAQGKVYFGRDAVARGVATDIGGYHDALSAIAKELKLDSRHDLHVVPYPMRGGFGAMFGRKKGVRNREDSERAAAGMSTDISLPALLLAQIPGMDVLVEHAVQQAGVHHEMSVNPYVDYTNLSKVTDA